MRCGNQPIPRLITRHIYITGRSKPIPKTTGAMATIHCDQPIPVQYPVLSHKIGCRFLILSIFPKYMIYVFIF